jgi:hypothetical protein
MWDISWDACSPNANHKNKFNKNTGYGGDQSLDYFNVIERSTHSLLGSHHFCGTLWFSLFNTSQDSSADEV